MSRPAGGCVGLARRELERDQAVNQPLLRAVVKIAHDATPLLVAGGDDPSPRCDQLSACRRVGDGCGNQLGKVGQPVLGAGREWLGLVGAGDQHSPHVSIDDHRRADL